ncbi:UNVERIFIED_CONTAM: hypothetical protein GTU68_066683 [Idotea baltica]|nr:hypothetical protein [Idotea baltica]
MSILLYIKTAMEPYSRPEIPWY